MRKPVIVKAYVCLYVSLSVHLEPVSDLTADAFIASLRHFIARRGKPSLILSDHGTNFTGANRELKEIYEFFNKQKTQGDVAHFRLAQCIEWKFISERAPHFGGLWEAPVKSMKFHFKRIVCDVKLTFEDLTTIVTQALVSLPIYRSSLLEALVRRVPPVIEKTQVEISLPQHPNW